MYKTQNAARTDAEENLSVKNNFPLASGQAKQVMDVQASEKSTETLPKKLMEVFRQQEQRLEKEIDLRVKEQSNKIAKELSDQFQILKQELKLEVEEKGKKLADDKQKSKDSQDALENMNLSWERKMSETTIEMSVLQREKAAVEQDRSNMKDAFDAITQQNNQLIQEKDWAIQEKIQANKEKDQAMQDMVQAIRDRDEADTTSKTLREQVVEIQVANERFEQENNILKFAAVALLIGMIQKEYPNLEGFHCLTPENLSPKLAPAFDATIKREQSISWLAESIGTFYTQNVDEYEKLMSTSLAPSISAGQNPSAPTVSNNPIEVPETLQPSNNTTAVPQMHVQAIYQPQALEESPRVQEIQVETNHTSNLSDDEEFLLMDEDTVQGNNFNYEHGYPASPDLVAANSNLTCENSLSVFQNDEDQSHDDDLSRDELAESTKKQQLGRKFCRFGMHCHNLLDETCEYHHPDGEFELAYRIQVSSSFPTKFSQAESRSLSQIPCKSGRRCKKPLGTCPYAHNDNFSETMGIPNSTKAPKKTSRLCKFALTASGCQKANCGYLHPEDAGFPLTEKAVNLLLKAMPNPPHDLFLGGKYMANINELSNELTCTENLDVPNRKICIESMRSQIQGAQQVLRKMTAPALQTLPLQKDFFSTISRDLLYWINPAALAKGKDVEYKLQSPKQPYTVLRALTELDGVIDQRIKKFAPNYLAGESEEDDL